MNDTGSSTLLGRAIIRWHADMRDVEFEVSQLEAGPSFSGQPITTHTSPSDPARQ